MADLIDYMDQLHRVGVQHVLYQDLSPSALSSHTGALIQQGLEHRHLGRHQCYCSLLSCGHASVLLYLRSLVVILDVILLDLEGFVALRGRSMA